MNESKAKISGNIGGAFILLAGILWGTMGVFVKKLTHSGFSSAEVSAGRWFFSALIIVAAVYLHDKKNLIIERRDIFRFALIGIFGFLLTSTFLYLGISFTSIAVADVLMYTSPIWVQIASVVFFKERLNLRKIICIVLTFLGCVLASGIKVADNSKISIPGIIFGLSAGICYASYSITASFMLKKYNEITVTAYSTLFAGLGSIFTVNVKRVASTISVDFESIIYILIIAICCTVIPYFLYTVGVKRNGPTTAAILSCAEPVTATLISVFIAKEQLSFFQAIGIMCIILAIVLLKARLDYFRRRV